MQGYIINFYKYATFPKTMKAKMNEYLNDSKTKQWGDGQKIDDTGELKKTLLVYGDFDRLSLEAVKSFHRYRDVEKYAQRWLGPRQSILLYQLADLSDADLLEEIFRKVSPEEVVNNADTYRNFVIFTMVTLDSTLHKASDFSKALHACADLIGTVVDAYKDEILDEPEAFKYQVYGSFSSSELVIVWSANQYTDALQMTNLLRDVSFQLKGCKDKGFELKELRPFSSFYSVVAQEKPRKQDGKVGKEIKGDAELRFVFQEGDSSSEDRRKFPKRFLDKLKEKFKLSEDEISTISLYPSVGEYDYCMRMPAKYLCNPYNNIFRRNGLLHWDNSAFKDIIATTHVQLYYDHDGLEADNLPKNVPLSIISPSDIQHMDDADMVIKLDAIKDQTYHGKNSAEIIQNSYLKKYRKNGLRDFIKECFPKTDGLCDTLDLLFSDYVNNCSNLTNPSWANDLTTQFSEMLDYIATQLIVCFSKNSIRDKVNVFRRIKQISSVFIQMIYHISQSRRTIFIVPSCHIRYMGQYDMILHAYYGLEKYLLKLAYKLPHDDLQPTLVPIFTIDVIPEIRTDMYKVTYHFDDERKTSAIFSLNMPLSAMTDFLRYSMVICHETAHFIAPISRNKRNQTIGMLYLSEFVAWCAVRKLLNEDDAEKRDLVRKLFPRLVQIIVPIVYNEFRWFFVENIHTKISEKNLLGEDESSNVEQCVQWKEYQSELSKHLLKIKGEQKNLKCICDFLFDKRDLILQTTNDVLSELQVASKHQVGDDLPQITADDRNWCLATIDSVIGIKNSDLRAQLLQEDLVPLIARYQEKMLSLSYMLSEAYREACQDLFMVTLFKLDTVDYLVFRDQQRIDILMLNEPRTESDQCRTAMICDYLLSKQYLRSPNSEFMPNKRDLLEKFDAFAPNYFKLMKQATGIDDDKIQEAFKTSRKSLAMYLFHYNTFRRLFWLQLKEMDATVTEKLQELNCEDILSSYYKKWKCALSQVEKKNRDSDIFQNNIEMIQYFQKQETLEQLASYNK